MSDSRSWLLAQPIEGLRISAEPDGIVLRSDNFSVEGLSQLRLRPKTSRLGRLLPTLIPQLLELDRAEAREQSITISYANFILLKDHDIDAFEDIVDWAPFALEIESKGILGRDNFRYSYRFYSGAEIAYPERLGCFVKRGARIFRLDREAYGIVEAIESFNASPSEQKESIDAFVRFSQIKGLGEGLGAQLDDFISKEKVLVPSRVGLDLIVESGGRITFAPKFDGASEDQMRKAFLSSDDVDQVYSLDDGNGGRVRIVLAEEHREVLRRMQRVRHLRGAERAEVLRDPNAAFDGVANSVEIDLGSYGPRVRGIGDFPFVVQPYLQRNSAGVFEDNSPTADTPRRLKIGGRIKVSIFGRVD
jgi:hypothetical protein